MTSDHFRQAQADLPQYLVETPGSATSRWTATTGTVWGSSRCREVAAGVSPPAGDTGFVPQTMGTNPELADEA